ncbi:hypothetical protein KI688_004809 [Linnemannia hyalina]|uniref:Uncharacterized protein n=1 Tax=Linnemannia hyalina TaxID=64524 RepID=A0A9P8BRR8_9FUNG|nr:hypothetical protein KI688_004809 [Linnemannia hyalina]
MLLNIIVLGMGPTDLGEPLTDTGMKEANLDDGCPVLAGPRLEVFEREDDVEDELGDFEDTFFGPFAGETFTNGSHRQCTMAQVDGRPQISRQAEDQAAGGQATTVAGPKPHQEDLGMDQKLAWNDHDAIRPAIVAGRVEEKDSFSVALSPKAIHSNLYKGMKRRIQDTKKAKGRSIKG